MLLWYLQRIPQKYWRTSDEKSNSLESTELESGKIVDVSPGHGLPTHSSHSTSITGSLESIQTPLGTRLAEAEFQACTWSSMMSGEGLDLATSRAGRRSQDFQRTLLVINGTELTNVTELLQGVGKFKVSYYRIVKCLSDVFSSNKLIPFLARTNKILHVFLGGWQNAILVLKCPVAAIIFLSNCLMLQPKSEAFVRILIKLNSILILTSPLIWWISSCIITAGDEKLQSASSNPPRIANHPGTTCSRYSWPNLTLHLLNSIFASRLNEY